MTGLAAIVMPKWGLSMTEGKVTAWLKAPGEIFDEGEDLVEIETSKIVNVYEAPFGSRLCRIVVGEDETVSVGALIAVASTGPASEDDIDAFVATHQNALADEDQSEQEPGGLALGFLQIGSMNLRYGISGDLSKGTPAVLIHGFSSDLNNWLFNVDAIRERAPVVLLELPGHGASSKAIETGDVSELASALDKMLGELKGGDV